MFYAKNGDLFLKIKIIREQNIYLVIKKYFVGIKKYYSKSFFSK